MTIFSSEFLGWNLLSSRFFIGTYYGILSTLPIAPSQLLSIRVLLLEDENKQSKMAGAGAAKGIFIAGVSGFLIAQLAMFLSIYSVPLYTFWFKPHLFNLILLPLLLWHYFKIIEFDPVAHLIPNYQYPILDPRVRSAFLESFLFQFLNPIVFPHPVFTRLMSIFFFQYSHIPMFICGSLLGWLSGQILFIFLSWTLLIRLQLDSPSIYRIVKRIVHAAFPPIMIGICLSYIGRICIMPFTERSYKKNDLWLSTLWPDSFYQNNQISDPMHFMLSPHQSKLRNQPNAPFNTLNLPLHKSHFSEYFFQSCITDGKYRLIHNYPINLSLIHSDLNTITEFPENQDWCEREWTNQKKMRLFTFNSILNKKISNLDTKIEDVVEKRLQSLNEQNLKLYRLSKYFKKNVFYPNKLSHSIRKYIKSHNISNNRIRKSYDSRLGIFLPNQSIKTKYESPWLMNQDKDHQISPINNRNFLPRWKVGNNRLIRLKQLISKLNIYISYFNLYKKVPVWKTGSKSSSFYYDFEFFKENLTRRRRRRFFVRSLVPGTLYGKSRNSTGIFRIFEAEPRSVFFLRAKEINLDIPESISYKQRLSQTESEKFDFANSHSVRGPALITQAFIRKYIKLPILILTKSIVRLLLIQSSEWNQDWSEWTKEKYIYCFYNGDYAPNNQLPPHWLGDGLQIKIVSPLHLKPWRPLSIKDDGLSLDINSSNVILTSSFINIWGQETDIPFGEVQHYSFFKPMFKGLFLFGQYQLAQLLTIFNRLLLYIEKKIDLIRFFVCQISNPLLKTQTNRDHHLINDIHEESLVKTKVHSNVFSLPETVDSKEQTVLSLYTDAKRNPIINNTNIDHQSHNALITNNEYIKSEKEISQTNLMNSRMIFSDSIESLLTVYDLKSHNLSFVSSSLNLKKPYQFLEYQKVKMNILMLQFYEQIIFAQKKIAQLLILFVQGTKKLQLTIQRIFLKSIETFVLFYKIQRFQLGIHFINLIQRVSFLQKETNVQKLNIADARISNNNHYALNNAYILHKIWQMNIPNRLSLGHIFMAWQPKYLLQDHIKMILNTQGLINKEDPKDINLHVFKEWLKPFKRYIPSPAIWNHISASSWKKKVTEFLGKQNILSNQVYYQNKDKYQDIYSTYLSYYKPLFQKAKKMNKRWKFQLLTDSYTDSVKNQNVDLILQGWYDKNREQIQTYRFQLMNKNSMLKKHIYHPERISWKLSNTKTNGLAPSLSFKKSFQSNLISNKKMIFISKKQPIYYKYENQFFLEENENLSLKQRVSFTPIFQYRWKSEQQRLKALNSIDAIKKAKSDLKDAIQKSMLANKNKMKSASIFDQKVKEATVRWKTISLSKFTCQVIKKRQARILDDEIIMHNMIASFFRFKNRYLNHQKLELLDFDFKQLSLKDTSLLDSSFFLPEEIFLQKSLREYRILNSLSFESDRNQHVESTERVCLPTSIKIQSYKNSYSYQLIKRYIWPSYRIEDLACMNRFWISTANQGRFSSLRIKIYPNLGE